MINFITNSLDPNIIRNISIISEAIIAGCLSSYEQAVAMISLENIYDLHHGIVALCDHRLKALAYLAKKEEARQAKARRRLDRRKQRRESGNLFDSKSKRTRSTE
jgi:hypothetical protein